jgi:UDP-N-acetylglucosamine--N-acetylmuramyl-(pentapeptide) pyrophosphoryl-undecaprenol N-acetylglucosamine transferase
MTNRWLARIATRVLEAFPGSFPAARRAMTVGNPVRAEILALADPDDRLATRSGRPRLLVIGGSQGALALNRLMPEALGRMALADRPEVWHQAGGQMRDTTAEGYRGAGVEVKLDAFIDDMAAAYGWADLVVCRAGALTVSELAAAGVGAILVPFPHAVDDHQTANAGFLEREGAAIVVQQADLTVPVLADLLCRMLADRGRLLGMARAARRLARADAAQRVVSLCVEQGRLRR